MGNYKGKNVRYEANVTENSDFLREEFLSKTLKEKFQVEFQTIMKKTYEC